MIISLYWQYDIDIYVNKQWRGKYEIIVKDNPHETCLTREIVKRLGINSDNFARENQCLTFEQLVQAEATPGYWDFSFDPLFRKPGLKS